MEINEHFWQNKTLLKHTGLLSLKLFSLKDIGFDTVFCISCIVLAKLFVNSRWRGTKPRNLPFWYSGLLKGGELPKPASLFFSAWEETVAMYCEPKCFSPQKCQPNWLNLLRSQVLHSPLQDTSSSKSQLRSHSKST